MNLAWDAQQTIGPIAQDEDGGWVLVYSQVHEQPISVQRMRRHAVIPIEPLNEVALRIAQDLNIFDWRTDESD